jgi:hypothetical protein
MRIEPFKQAGGLPFVEDSLSFAFDIAVDKSLG